MFTIRAIEKSSGRPWKGVKVDVCVAGLFSGGFLLTQTTDAGGEAHFDHEPCRGKVYVRNRQVHEDWLEGRVVLYL